MNKYKEILRVILAMSIIIVGILHFAIPEPFVKIVPPQLPSPLALVYISGIFEILGGIGGRLYIVDKRTRQIALQAGLTIRNGDAFSPHIGLLYNRWKVGLNFDSNFSNFKTATNRLGGPEINFIYIFAKVPPAICPLCPVYL